MNQHFTSNIFFSSLSRDSRRGSNLTGYQLITTVFKGSSNKEGTVGMDGLHPADPMQLEEKHYFEVGMETFMMDKFFPISSKR